MKDELCGKIMTEFAALRPKTCSYLTDDSDENKNAKGIKKCIIKGKLIASFALKHFISKT